MKIEGKNYLSREKWLITYKQLENLMKLVQNPQIKDQLKKYQERSRADSRDGFSDG